jgi:hypothetical protein
LHNLCTDDVMIRSELKYVIRAKVGRTVTVELCSGSNPVKNRRFMSGLGNKPAKANWVRFLAGSGIEQNQTKPNQTKLLVKTRTAGWIPRPVANNKRPYTPLAEIMAVANMDAEVDEEMDARCKNAHTAK